MQALSWPVVYVTAAETPTTQMMISWITDTSDNNDTLFYKSEKKKSAWRQVTGTHTIFATNTHHVHHVQLSGLKPNTKYQFKIKGNETFYYFKTLADTPPIRLIVGGDTNQINLETFRTMCRRVALHAPHLVIFGGDLAYANREKTGSESLTLWLEWLNAYSQSMQWDGCLIPLAVTAGNHDVPGFFGASHDTAQALYTLFPGNGYHAIHIPKWLSIFFLDSGHSTPIAGIQTQWLSQILEKKKDSKNRFAVYHIPAYPVAQCSGREYTKQIREHWIPLFERYKLHIAFENHEHLYKRTFPLVQGTFHPQGTVYMGGGSFGASPRKPKVNLQRAVVAKQSMHFVIVDIALQKRTLTARSETGVLLDFTEQPY